jgi:GT2 family glycosyltransferase
MSHPISNPHAFVTVVMPVLNERHLIAAALQSVRAQATPNFQLEILVVDGMSEDGTRQKIAELAAEDPRIRLLNNPQRHTPAALNLGLRAATGDYVCIMGAHASYDPDYIAVCLEEMIAHDAVACSGKVITVPGDSSLQARLVAWAVEHPFASSSASVRTQAEGYVDTVPFPVIRKQALLDAGGYNERLLRNQDNDMNQRLRAMGFRLYATAKTRCRYCPRPGIKPFLQYAFSSGLWNARSMKENPASLAFRHFVPLAFVTVLLILSLFVSAALLAPGLLTSGAALALGIIVAAHLGMGAMAGVEVGLREKTAAALCLAPLILAFHCCYGLGTLRGLFYPTSFADQVSGSLRTNRLDSDY